MLHVQQAAHPVSSPPVAREPMEAEPSPSKAAPAQEKELVVALLSCPPDVPEIKASLERSAVNEVKTVFSFVEGAAIFVLSRLWSDMLSAFIFRLHPIPYCEKYLWAECAPEADSYDQFIFAISLVPVGGLVKHLSESTGLTERPGYDDIPMILNYVVGWAFGNAFVKLLMEIQESHPQLCEADLLGDGPADCTYLNVGFTCAMTVLSAVIVVFIQPLTKDVECGDGALIDWLEDLVEDIWAMVIRGAIVTAMSLWNYTVAQQVAIGVADNSVAFYHSTLFFAGFSTWIGASFSAQLEVAEGYLKSDAMAKARAEAVEMGEDPDEAELPLATAGLVQFSDLLQCSTSFVVANAWSNVVMLTFSTLGHLPHLATIVANVSIALGLLVFGAGWLVLTGDKHGKDASDVHAVEKHFVTNALAFFVGTVGVVAMRNVSAPLQLTFEAIVTLVQWLFGAEGDGDPDGSSSGADDAGRHGFGLVRVDGDTLSVLIICIVLSMLLFSAEQLIESTYAKKAKAEKPVHKPPAKRAGVRGRGRGRSTANRRVSLTAPLQSQKPAWNSARSPAPGWRPSPTSGSPASARKGSAWGSATTPGTAGGGATLKIASMLAKKTLAGRKKEASLKEAAAAALMRQREEDAALEGGVGEHEGEEGGGEGEERRQEGWGDEEAHNGGSGEVGRFSRDEAMERATRLLERRPSLLMAVAAAAESPLDRAIARQRRNEERLSRTAAGMGHMRDLM